MAAESPEADDDGVGCHGGAGLAVTETCSFPPTLLQ